MQPRERFLLEVAAPFLHILGGSIPPQHSFKFSDFSKCFILNYIASAGLDRWLQFHIVEANLCYRLLVTP